MATRNHYVVLGVSPSVSPAALEKAYHRLAREKHPDKGSDQRRKSSFRCIRILLTGGDADMFRELQQACVSRAEIILIFE